MDEQTDRTAAYFQQLGIGHGDKVMLILKRHYQWWLSMMALCKLGAIAIPATHMLTKGDIVYRNNRASVKAIVCCNDAYVTTQVTQAMAESPTVRQLVAVNSMSEQDKPVPEGFHDWRREWAEAPHFRRPEFVNTNEDTMLMYFTSGTSGEPKMVAHDFLYALGHLTTGCFWHNLGEDSIHLTVADTGWGKAVWGKLYGQWFAGATVFVFDHEKFTAEKIMRQIEKYRITSFCAPPTIYRFMILEDFSKYDLSSLQYCTTAGEAMNPSVEETFYQLSGKKILYNDGALGQVYLPVFENVPACSLDMNDLVTRNGYSFYRENGNITSIAGIDISEYQHDINWEQVKAAGVDFAMIRVGYRTYGGGEMTLDAKFKENIEQADAAGIKVGVYFFSQAVTTEEAIEEADFVLDAIKPYNITYEKENGEHEYVHQTTLGMTERLLGAVVGIHGDNSGLVLPPAIAPVQAVIIPIFKKDNEAEVMQVCRAAEAALASAGIRAKLDDSDGRPGAKFYVWELKGVPLRLEIGGKDIENGVATFARRDTGAKGTVELESIGQGVRMMLDIIASDMMKSAEEKQKGFIDDFSDMSAESIPEGRIVRIGWCGSPECGHKFEDKYDMKILGTPYRPEEWKGRCVCCGKEGCGPAYAARTL